MSQIIGRGLELLEAVTAAPEPLGLMDIVEATGLDKSTASRTLAYLVERGSLVRDPSTKRYSIGPRTFALAAAVGARNDIRQLSAPYLDDLCRKTGESVSLHLRVGGRRVCVDGRESPHPLRRVVPLGESLSVHLGPSGKVILAHLPEDEAKALLSSVDLSESDRRQLMADLDKVRSDGYLHTESDRTRGVRAVSAPVFDANGVTGSLTVAGPAQRWRADDAEAAAAITVAAAATISTHLGARG
ncbi:MAG: IclR family transcriptional regulator [Motilibacteraceae bacterium]